MRGFQVGLQFAIVLDACARDSVLGVSVDVPGGFYGQCPCCFTAGRTVTLAGVHFECKPLDTLEIDFCFKLTHLFKRWWRAVMGDSYRPPNHDKFIDNPVVVDFLANNQATESQPCGPDDIKECNDFAAASVTGGKESVKNDINGLGGCYCLHSYVEVVMNCFKGEQYAYAILMLALVLGLSDQGAAADATLAAAAQVSVGLQLR